MMRKSQISSRSHNQQKQSDGETAGRDLMLFGTSPAHRGGVFLCSVNVRFWPKADTRGRVLGPKIGHPAFSELLSVRFRPKADVTVVAAAARYPSVQQLCRDVPVRNRVTANAKWFRHPDLERPAREKNRPKIIVLDGKLFRFVLRVHVDDEELIHQSEIEVLPKLPPDTCISCDYVA